MGDLDVRESNALKLLTLAGESTPRFHKAGKQLKVQRIRIRASYIFTKPLKSLNLAFSTNITV
jgi:hypothetical protein